MQAAIITILGRSPYLSQNNIFGVINWIVLWKVQKIVHTIVHLKTNFTEAPRVFKISIFQKIY